jgi:branched-chain amino acid transport system ATP-binding protein
MLLAVDNLVKRFGGLTATDDVTLDVAQGEIHAIIGPNGAGKTTLIAQLAGELRPDAGTIRFNGENITALPAHIRAARGLSRSFQINSIFQNFTALENVALAIQVRRGHCFRFWAQVADDSALEKAGLDLLAQVHLEGRAHASASDLAHGERRALEVAIALASQPKLLLLDEPLAGMGIDESLKIVKLLGGLKTKQTILLIEHDMNAVFALADRITVLVYGRVVATGSPEEIRVNPDVRRAYLGEDEDS